MAVRVYLDEEFEINRRFRLPPNEWHYLKNVRRGSGKIEVFNRLGQLANAEVEGREIIIQNWVEARTSLPPGKVTVAVGLPESALLKVIVRQASELGLTELIFFEADRSQKAKRRMSELEKLEKVVVESMRQSERQQALKLSQEKLENLLQEETTFQKLVMDEDPNGMGMSMRDLPVFLRKKSEVLILVGPEGGWSVRERELFDEFNIQRLHLSTPILRVDTAIIAGAIAAFAGFELSSKD